MDLPPAVHRRAQELAAQSGRSLSSTIADLTMRGLGQLEAPIDIQIDERSGFPVISVGRRVTSGDVAAAIEE